MGRICTYTDEMATQIEDWLCEGKTLRSFCRQDGKPSFGTVYAWIKKIDGFAERLERAREIGADAISEECMEIMDDSTNDYMERMASNGESYPALNAEHIQRSKLRVWGRLELLKVWHPQKYGNRTVLAGDKDSPLLPQNMSDEERASRISAIIEAAKLRKEEEQ